MFIRGSAESNSIAITRNEYGALSLVPEDSRVIAKELLGKAISSKKLDAEYCHMTYQKRLGYTGWCLNYDVYDITKSAVLVQRRETERTKYGTSPHKDYFIIRRCGKGVRVTEAPKARVVKLAKLATKLGQVIDTLEGRTKTPLKQIAPFSEKTTAYKIVEQRDGTFYSVFDNDFEWALGKARTEAATDSHDGGFYVFLSMEEAQVAYERNVVFTSDVLEGKKLALLECEVAGRQHEHDNGKVCVTFCRPMKFIAMMSMLQKAA